MFCGQTGGQKGSHHLSFLKSSYALEGFVVFLIYILEDILGLSEGDSRVTLCQVSHHCHLSPRKISNKSQNLRKGTEQVA